MTKNISDNHLNQSAKVLAQTLLQKNLVVSTAESCTGGWLGKCFTEISGSSDWYMGGWISYANRAKQDMLDVSQADLQQHGAVSPAVVSAMAAGALKSSGADLSVAISGVAGPSGGSKEKPVGTVYIATANKDKTVVERFAFAGDRDQVRRQSVSEAIALLARMAGEMS